MPCLSCWKGQRFDHSDIADGKTWRVRATDALTVEKGAEKVEVLWKAIVRGTMAFPHSDPVWACRLHVRGG